MAFTGDTAQSPFSGYLAHAAELRALVGPQEYDERVAGWRSKRAAIADGLLRRELFTAALR